MRDWINLIETTLTESTGLAGRKPGDVFKNQEGDTLTFSEIRFFPEEGGKFTSDELTLALDEIASQIEVPIQWENVRSGRTGGFAVATFMQGDATIAVGRYMDQTKQSFTDNFYPNMVLGTYRFAGKAALKTQAGMTPQDILTTQSGLSSADILDQVIAKFGNDHPLSDVARHVAFGGEFPFAVEAMPDLSFTAFRDYFCELMQPIALQSGNYTGNARDAASRFLGEDTFENTTISFDSSKNAGLADSRLELSNGAFIKVSSKGAKGAEASVKNLIDCVNELEGSPVGSKITQEFAEVIEIVKEIQIRGQAGSPLYLGVKFGLITEEEAEVVRKLKGGAPVDITKPVDGLTPELTSLMQTRTTKTPEKTNLYYHMLAAIAHQAAEKVNQETDFSAAASQILNNGALVQVYTKAKEQAGKWVLQGFEAVYPGDAVTGVVISAGKNYSSTGIKGNFTFKILRGGAKAVPDDTEEVPGNPFAQADTVKVAKKKTAAIVEPRIERPAPTEKKGVGRAKR